MRTRESKLRGDDERWSTVECRLIDGWLAQWHKVRNAIMSETRSSGRTNWQKRRRQIKQDEYKD